MSEAKQLSSAELAEVRQRQVKRAEVADLWLTGTSQAATDIDSLLSHIAALKKENKRLEYRLAERVGVIDDFIVQTGGNVNNGMESNIKRVNGIAESTRTLLIEVVKGMRDEYASRIDLQPTIAPLSVNVTNEIITALEATELKQDSESVR